MARSKKGTAAPQAATLSATAQRKLAKQLAAEQLAAKLERDADNNLPHCSVATLQAITASTRRDGEARSAMVAAVDGLFADNIKPENLYAPKEGDDKTFYASIASAVVAGFTAEVQALLKAEQASLPAADKQPRRYWQMQIGSKIKDLRNALERRITKAEADGEAKGANDRSNLQSRIVRDCGKFIAQLEKASEFGGDKEACLTALRAAVKAAS